MPRRRSNPRKHTHARAQNPDTMSKPTEASSSIPLLDMIQESSCNFPPRRNANRGFAQLPHDIALCILDELRDPIDRVCFALMTKSLWPLMRAKLRLEQFSLPAVLPPRVTVQRGVIQNWPVFTSLRWKLLERLEDNHWKCCAGCVRLHPRRDYFYSELYRPPKDRFCKTPGLIQLCAHIYLTYKKCASLQKALADAPAESNTKAVGDVAMNEALRHECHLVTDGVKLTFSVQPFLSPRFRQLMLHNTYNVKGFQSGKLKECLQKFGNGIFLPCPHRGILTHCLDMTCEGPWDSTMVDGDSKDTSKAMCMGCDTLYFKFQTFTHSISQKQMHEFIAQRFIGDYSALGECKVGRGNPDVLQAWLNKTNLANVLKVDSIHDRCHKCRGKEGRYCAKLSFIRFTCPSWKVSLPDTRWKQIQ
ncbi:hypothetical protein UA08_06136 [Talaromyces atroroseus]|uniref:F-box domain-containing protein n=1 Tax=Talaromyces atroroseus TaxID=1441469 RepID=A0A225AGV5_TALAT|nr:hypothetical protein UA08_06136 [Talaromyces atroroseus]OKL58433.1 hypothetical protein UA08_06136 [Talaromyces atroroseus]